MYDGLARFYDLFTGDIDYDALTAEADSFVAPCVAVSRYIERGERPIILDCACGTGSVTVRLRERGYDCIGLDISEEMLNVARENGKGDGNGKMQEISVKSDSSGGCSEILWVCQDMCRMDLYGSVAAVFCLTDAINHLTKISELRSFLSRAHNFLDFGGVLVFDALTEEHFTEHGCPEKHANSFECYADYEEGSCFWTARYSPKTMRCVYDISCFMARDDGLYERYDDTVTERVWPRETLIGEAKAAGFKNVRVRRARTSHLGGFAGNRLFFACYKEDYSE